MIGSTPPENFPPIGPVANCAVFYTGEDTLLLCYEIGDSSGGGTAILSFDGLIDFRINPLNTRGLHKGKYPANMYDFTEITGSAKQKKWRTLKPRLWVISFNDETIEVLFQSVEKRAETRKSHYAAAALLEYLRDPSNLGQ